MSDVRLNELRELARQAEELEATNLQELALLGHFLGAVYSLDRAYTLRVEDREREVSLDAYSDELRRVAQAIGKRASLGEIPWLSDYYLNSALYRLSAVAERLSKYGDQDRRFIGIKDLVDDVDRMKHDVEGRLTDRSVRFNEALGAARKVVEALTAVLTKPHVVSPRSNGSGN